MTPPPGAQERAVSTGHRLARQYGETFYDEDALAKDIDQAIAQAVQAERDERLTYPDDPACSVAAMLSRMSPEDKQAFNFCVKTAVAQAEAQLRERERELADKAAQLHDSVMEKYGMAGKLVAAEREVERVREASQQMRTLLRTIYDYKTQISEHVRTGIWKAMKTWDDDLLTRRPAPEGENT